ncbi:mechanosensitive ion channel domain-containing protein [Aliiroseovarius subalbicans]|uniref:mechanosensitive ion channel family protein n=1 Tax=Aliiroseovarius subalbicans TaxID=2925840 RepID=UPI001F595D97|nr:mechanosensitive ion channel domain-containing protein [uncultured Aliiroseovarius sp.]MCI2400172.1 mechanosensitive ion channel [Aliiroseovarius subalbicans]
MENQPEIITKAIAFFDEGWEIAQGWLLSPAAWSQFALLVVAFLAALVATRKVSPLIKRVLTPSGDKSTFLSRGRLFVLIFLPLLLPVLAWGFTALGEQVTRSIFGSGAVIAFGKRVFLFLAARILVREVISDPFLKVLGKYVLIPVAAIYAVGLLGPAVTWLENTVVPLGNMSFSLLFAIRFAAAGGIIFWLGRWSNEQSSSFIKQQKEMRPATRELAAKAAEIAIFGAAFLVLMNIMGISLTSLAVLGGAIGVGLGFGLQQIAANFISGVILLIEGQATVGDYVELDGGEAGTIVKMTARAAILETFDGRWIVVPNEHFITTRVVNYSDAGSANRYEAEFSVSYDSDVEAIPALIEAAVAKLDFVMTEPEEHAPDCELRAFGDSGVEFAVEFWVNGIDDGKNKFTPKVLMEIWKTLKAEGIEIPFPQRVVEIKGGFPQ